MKKILVILVAIALLLAACGGNTQPPATTTAATTEAATTQAATTQAAATEAATTQAATTEAPVSQDDVMTPYGRYPETIILTTATQSSWSPGLVDGEDVENNAMTKFIYDRANIKIQVLWESPDFGERLAMAIAANDLPDMFTLSPEYYLMFKQLVDNDRLEDLTDAYNACANEYTKTELLSYGGRNLEPFRDGNRLLAFAGGQYGYEHNQLWLRQDWMEKYDLSAPSTLEDIESILSVWRDDPPTEDYVGMVLDPHDIGGVYQYQSAAPVFAAFGAYPGAWVQNSAGEIIWGSVAPEMKNGLEVLAKWYAEGLIDKQFPTRIAEGATESLILSGASGAVFVPWWYPYAIDRFPFMNPTGELKAFNAPLDSSGKFNIMFPGPASEFVMIRKGYAHPEALFKVINLEFDAWREFDQELADLIRPNRDNGVDWGYIFPTGFFNIEPDDVIPRVGALAKAMVETGSLGGLTGTPMDVNMAENAAEYARTGEAEGMNWVDYYCRYMASNLMEVPEINIVYPKFSFITESMADIKPNLDTLEARVFLQIIMGEQPVEAFDQFVTDWYNQGGTIMTEEVRATAG